jgi:hypothetical protein
LFDVYKKLHKTSIKHILLNYQWTQEKSFLEIYNSELERKKLRKKAIKNARNNNKLDPNPSDENNLNKLESEQF